jgi:hypothetical protein
MGIVKPLMKLLEKAELSEKLQKERIIAVSQ